MLFQWHHDLVAGFDALQKPFGNPTPARGDQAPFSDAAPAHTPTLVVRTPAKLNLFLEVLGKRPDGYHELETLMVMIGLYDDLLFAPTMHDELSLTTELLVAASTAEPLPRPQDNLVWKAAELLRQRTGCRQGAAIHLRKRIPLASGMAGGSSDCAATLAGLNRLWDLRLTTEDLIQLGAELGSDVPFFFSPTPAAICRGRGEILAPLPAGPALHFVIVRPRTGLSTAAVFSRLQREGTHRPAEKLQTGWNGRNRPAVCAQLWNRLQVPAEALNAEISGLRQVFSRLPVLAHQMSGSGTSYFGICSSRRQAMHVASRVRGLNCGQVFVADCRA
ncbi:MAG: 4-(cytidine 5'-diphospho)-2-C-methyl-D-erythritol kinase [Planctomycetales bacterium]